MELQEALDGRKRYAIVGSLFSAAGIIMISLGDVGGVGVWFRALLFLASAIGAIFVAIRVFRSIGRESRGRSGGQQAWVGLAIVIGLAAGRGVPFVAPAAGAFCLGLGAGLIAFAALVGRTTERHNGPHMPE